MAQGLAGASAERPGIGAAVLPAVALPKGGGALRGLGETFSVRAATGSGGLTVPLPLSPGRDGKAPALQLSYDSDGGNGPFGLGWSLQDQAITRKTDKGLPQYCDGAASDVFILAGAEDLVPVLDATGARSSAARTVFGVAYTVWSYRPRIEGAFTRIERWLAEATGLTHWRSISRDNVTSLYGYDAASRVANPADPTQIFTWGLCRSWDDKGNLVLYDHRPEDGAGIDTTSAHEANRTAAARAAQTYLKSVRYGNIQPYAPAWTAEAEPALPTDFLFELVLDYGDHAAIPPTPDPDGVWPVRPDPFSSRRAGFEIRSYRRVQRVLLFHDFPNETTAGADRLVRSLDLSYSDQGATPDALAPIYTFLTAMTQTGYNTDGTSRAWPPLQFDYSAAVLQSAVLTLDPDSAENLPEGLDGVRYRWVDLDGEGLPGILSDAGAAWFYKRNRSANNQVELSDGTTATRARFGLLETVAGLPGTALRGGAQALVDLTGSGVLDVVSWSDPDAGYYRRDSSGSFEPFRQFAALPQIDWQDPNLRFLDLTGDGLADVLITEEGLYTAYTGLGEAGFGPATTVRTPWDEELGPALIVADGTQTIFIADMSGDGLNDLVRVRNGEVSYWPNLGYGRFGARICMDRAPRFAAQALFDPQRIRLADIDGSGTADILYLASDGVRIWFNQSGNAWSAPTTLSVFPALHQLAHVQVLDLLGNGTACLVWSSPLPGEAPPLRYVDLMGGTKPHLLLGVRNNLGAETRVSYAPSTKFYRQDEDAGSPWVTRLPFPVQVVERVETIDWIGRTRLVTRYAYHHGYFDGFEREFRGFGRVDQWDTEEYRNDVDFTDGAALNWSADSWSSPVLTRSWFLTGAFQQAQAVSRQYAGEYWNDPTLDAAADWQVPDTLIPDGLNAYEVQEAYRALKGQPVRREVYVQHAALPIAAPYAVTQTNFTLTCLQPMGANLHAVFYVHARESVSLQYEQTAGDPRVDHRIVLATDAYGSETRSVAIGYPRRSTAPPPVAGLPAFATTMLAYDQARLHILASGHGYTNALDDSSLPDIYRAPRPAATDTAELTGIAPATTASGAMRLFSFEDFAGTSTMPGIWATAWAGANDVPYEAIPASDIDGTGTPATVPTRRLVMQDRTLYLSDDQATLLPQGTLQGLALPGETYACALTPGLLAGIFGALVPPATLTEGGYIQLANEAGWWMPSGRIAFFPAGEADPTAFAQANFYRPVRALDPFGGVTSLAWDVYALLPVSSTDPVGNTTLAANDYRVLAPAGLTDANGNRSAAAFDVHGLVTATAVMGKTGEALGDALTGFTTDLDDAALAALFADPLAAPATLLGNATTRVIADFGAYQRSLGSAAPAPAAVYTLARETHVADLGTGGHAAATLFQHSLSYTDGFGREIQRKIRMADGPLTAGGATASPRWVGSGWTILDNKGRPVRQYEPFFTATGNFEFAQQVGVCTTLVYDALGRQVATLHPDSSWEKTIFSTWQQANWDGNDTVLLGDPRSDPDIGPWLLGSTPFVSWYDQRIGGTYGTTAEAQAAQRDAAQKAAAHEGTPTITCLDPLGRSALVLADAGDDQYQPLRTASDIQGRALAVFDAAGRRVQENVLRVPLAGGGMQYVAGTDMTGQPLYRIGQDSGARRGLNDVAGKPIRGWDARGHAFRFVYDAARRPLQRYVATAGAPEILIDLTIYGEGQAASNLCGRVFRHYDMAGFTENSAYDFKGNLLASARQLASAYRQAPDWTPLAALTTTAALDIVAQTDGLIPGGDDGRDRFAGSIGYDALNRPIQVVAPRNATMAANVIRRGYDAGALLTTVDVWLQQEAAPTTLLDPATADRHVVTAITYDARGQRSSVAYGNATTTAFSYDPQSFRPATLVTTRPAGFAADASVVQALAYFYDPVGNLTRVRDDADTQDVIFFQNQRVEPSADYTYDPLYRLTIASGREHLGQNGATLLPPQQVTNDDSWRTGQPQPSDGSAMGVYTETYGYDAAQNIAAMAHQVSSGSWSRGYAYLEASQIDATELGNRLSATSLPGDPAAGPFRATYAYDAHGNMTRMPHLPALDWDEDDRLRSTTRQVNNTGTPPTSYYAYDGAATRIRKVSDGQAAAGQAAMRSSERIYLGTVELFREFAADGTTIALQRETLHVDAGLQLAALVETRTAGTDPAPAQQMRYQFGNHLGSAVLELDDMSGIISYEEYFPFGSTSYQAVASQTDVAKRYRYSGKERDEENDLNYHGARYDAPWLGRWVSADPIGIKDGTNVYAFVSNNPIKLRDKTGMAGETTLSSTGDLVLYADKISNKASLGSNIQKDHAISQKVIKTILGPLESLYKEGRDLTTAVETGAAGAGGSAKWHTVKSTLEKGLQASVSSITAEGNAVSLGADVVEPTVGILKAASGTAELGRQQYIAVLSQLGNLHGTTTLQQTGELAAIIEGGDAAKLTAKVAQLAKSTKGAAKSATVLRNIATSENAIARIAKAAPVLSNAAGLLGKAAPIANVVGKIAGPLSIGISAIQLATAKNTDERIDAGIGLVGNSLLASSNPVAMAGGAGIAAGQALEHGLHVSDYSSQHGLDAQALAQRLGASEGVAFAAGAAVTIASTPVAIAEGAVAKVRGWF